ncbi:MAG TPA: YqzL family protein [Clostridiaceae bacterium]|nr:YqzL family protein [Clostridiaceae bacterium]
MRDYSWRLFEMTGDINSYMLYKEAGKTGKSNKNKTGEQQGTDIDLKE